MPVADALTGGLNAGTNFAMHQQSRRRDAFDMQQKQVENYNSIVGQLSDTLAKTKEQFEAKLATTTDLAGKQKISGDYKQFFDSTVSMVGRAGQKAASSGIPVDPTIQVARLMQHESLRDLAAEQALAGTQAATAGGQLAQAKVQPAIDQAGGISNIEPSSDSKFFTKSNGDLIEIRKDGSEVNRGQLSKPASTENVNTRDVTPKTQATIEGKLISTGDAIRQLKNIRRSVKEEYFKVAKRAGFKIDEISSILGKDLSAEDTKAIKDFATFQTETFDNFNLYVKSITGAAMSATEADRIEKAMPVSGDGVWPKMSYEKFISALTRIETQMADIQIRYMLMQKQGLATGDIEADKAAGVGDAAEAFMSHDEARRQYEARGEQIYEQKLAETGSEGTARAATQLLLKREFGL